MPCYQCNRCNKCGMLDTRLDLRCGTCGEPIPPGRNTCAKCGTKFINNMKTGSIYRVKHEERQIAKNNKG